MIKSRSASCCCKKSWPAESWGLGENTIWCNLLIADPTTCNINVESVHSGGVVDAWRSGSLEILYSKLMSRMLELALPSIIPSSCSLPRIASSGPNWKIVRKLVIVNASQEWTSERDPRSQVQLINADRIESQGRNEPGKRLLNNRFRV